MAVANFYTWQNNTASSWWRDRALRRNVAHIFLLYWCVFSFGYDGSLLNGLQALPQWKAYFHSPAGSILGIISASYYFPKIVMPVFVVLINDRFGRKLPILLGAIITLAGAIGCAFANGTNTFIGARVLLGAGYSFHAISAAPMIQELAHPRLRAIAASGFLSMYYVGSVTSAWLTYGMTRVTWHTSNWTWRLPCLLQAVGPLIIIAGWWFLPESPRFLLESGQEARAIRYYETAHANGASIDQDELVRNEVAEIRESVRFSGDAKNTSYKYFIQTPGNRKRLFIIIVTALGSQLCGNGIVSFYLSPILKIIGITNAKDVTAINGGLAIMNLVVTIAAASQVERAGRRPLWIAGMAGMTTTIILVGGLSAGYVAHKSAAIGSAVVGFLYLFYAFYDISFTALPYVYLPEILPFAARSKGIGIYSFVQAVSLSFNQYANPVALAAISWKYYFVYAAVDICLLVAVVWKFPETKNKTPEEIVLLFDKDAHLPPGIVDAETPEAGMELGPEDDTKDHHIAHLEDK